MSLRAAIALFLCCLTLSPGLHATARFESPWLASNGLSLDAAVRLVKQQTGGRILSAETVTRNGDRVHRIKVLLPDGTVRVMTYNAAR